MRVPEATREAIAIHQAAGRRFEAGGVSSFVRDQPPSVGTGEAVVLVHGVPSSSFLYRKMIPVLAQQGLRAIAFDFPGLGLADRPARFDYSWSGLARWMGQAIDALGIERSHAAAGALCLLLPAQARRRRAGVSSDHARLRAHRWEAALLVGGLGGAAL